MFKCSFITVCAIFALGIRWCIASGGKDGTDVLYSLSAELVNASQWACILSKDKPNHAKAIQVTKDMTKEKHNVIRNMYCYYNRPNVDSPINYNISDKSLYNDCREVGCYISRIECNGDYILLNAGSIKSVKSFQHYINMQQSYEVPLEELSCSYPCDPLQVDLITRNPCKTAEQINQMRYAKCGPPVCGWYRGGPYNPPEYQYFKHEMAMVLHSCLYNKQYSAVDMKYCKNYK